MIYPYDTVIVLAPGVSGTETGLFVKFVGTLSELNIYSATLAQNLVDLDIITDFPSWDAFIAAGGKLIANGTAVTSGTTLIQPNDPIRLLKPDYPYGYSGEDGYSGPAEGAPAWVAGLWIR
jgi:hypothetical protein